MRCLILNIIMYSKKLNHKLIIMIRTISIILIIMLSKKPHHKLISIIMHSKKLNTNNNDTGAWTPNSI